LVIFYWGISPIASDTQLSFLPYRGMISLMKRGTKKFKANGWRLCHEYRKITTAKQGTRVRLLVLALYKIHAHILLLGLANNRKDLEYP
jgi:hypothetical protein